MKNYAACVIKGEGRQKNEPPRRYKSQKVDIVPLLLIWQNESKWITKHCVEKGEKDSQPVTKIAKPPTGILNRIILCLNFFLVEVSRHYNSEKKGPRQFYSICRAM